jgi:hypothetical protein
MRNHIFTLLFIFLVIFNIRAFSDTITMHDALQQKLISFTAKSAGGFTGQCIIFTLQNKSSQNLMLHLEAGRFMMPSDSTRQRMVITKEQFITVKPNSTETAKSYAMCTQMHKSSPVQKTTFTMGNMAEGNLLKLIEIISKNNFQTMTAQSAVWAVSDANDVTDVYSDNKDEMIILRKFISKTTSTSQKINNTQEYTGFFKIKNDISDSTFLKYSSGKLEGAIQFELKADALLYLTLYTEKGTLAKSCFQNKLYKAGVSTIKYEFDYASAPNGNYYLKLYDSKGNVFVNKFLTVKSAVYSF